MKKKKWIVLRLETKSREFQSRTLLAYHLVKRGYGVIITRDYGDKSTLFPKGLYLVNNIFKTNQTLLDKIKKQGSEIIVLDEEGLVYVNKYQYLKRVPKENLDKINKFLCYGKEQHDLLVKTYPEHKDKFEITGNPRINLLNKMFDNIEIEKVENIRRKHAPYFLIVSNFAKVNLFGADKKTESRYNKIFKKYLDLEFFKNEKDVEEFKSSFDHINTIFESFLEIVELLVRKFPTYKVVVRPHPSEDRKIWDDIARKYTNLEIIYEGNLTEWIKGSELVIQNGCTSAIESLFINKNCISYRPYINEKFDPPLINKLSKNVSTTSELLDITMRIQTNSDDEFITDEYDRFREMATENISFFKNDESIEKIIDVIEKVDVKPINYSKAKFNTKRILSRLSFSNLYRFAKRGSGIFVHKALSFIGFRKNKFFRFLEEKISSIEYARSYQKNKLQTLSVEEIEEIMNKYNNIYSTDQNIRVEQLDNESFIIE